VCFLANECYFGAFIRAYVNFSLDLSSLVKVTVLVIVVLSRGLLIRSLSLQKHILLTQSPVGRAGLIAAAAPHSGDFLQAVPYSLCIAVALRLGATMCAPRTCVCGDQVDSSGIHCLACRKSYGRHMRHNAVNDLIKRALTPASIPAMLEPHSLCKDDGRRPDGLTVLPWANGRCMV
jgi:hypothetical protein